MGIVFRQSVKTTIVNFTGAALGGFIVFISTYVFSKQELGFTRIIIYAGALMNFVALLGTSSLAYTFTQRYDPFDKRKKVLVTLCTIVPIVATVLLTIPYMIFRKSIVNIYQPEDRVFVDTYYLWLPLLTLFWALMSFLDLYLISQLRVAVSAFMREVLLRASTLGVIALFYYKIISFHQLVVGMVLVYAIPPLFMLLVAARTEGFGFSTQWNVFSKAEYREMAHYSWYHLLFGMSLNVMGYIDALMLAPLDKNGMSSVAVYTTAVFLISLMVIPFRAMTSATYPILNKAYIQNDHDTLTNLFHRSGVNILIVAVAMFVLIGCNLSNAVAVLPESYGAIAPLVLILMIGRMMDMATGLNNELISMSKYYRFNFYLSIFLVILAIVFNRIFIPQYGFYGAAWSATLSLALFNLAKMIFLWSKMRLLPFTSKSWLVLVAGAAAGLAGYYQPHINQTGEHKYLHVLLDVCSRSALILIIYTGLLILLKPSEDLNNYISTIRKDKRLF